MKLKFGLAILLGVLMVISTLYFAQALAEPEKLKLSEIAGNYEHSGSLGYKVELKPNVIYGSEVIGTGDAVYSALLKNMSLIYTYSFKASNGTASGDYVLNVILTPEKGQWKKTIVKRSGSFDGSFTETIPLNWTAILSLWDSIERETKYNFGQPRLLVDVNVRVNGAVGGKEVSEKFLHEATVTYGKVLNFDGLTASKEGELYEDRVVPNQLGMGVDVGKAKIIFGSLSAVSLMAFSGIVLVSRNDIKEFLAKRGERTFNRKYGKVTFAAASKPDFEKIVELESIDSLGRISFELDRPIIRYNNELMVIDGETVYIYKKNNLFFYLSYNHYNNNLILHKK